MLGIAYELDDEEPVHEGGLIAVLAPAYHGVREGRPIQCRLKVI